MRATWAACLRRRRGNVARTFARACQLTLHACTHACLAPGWFSSHESHLSSKDNTPEALKRRLGFHSVFAPTRTGVDAATAPHPAATAATTEHESAAAPAAAMAPAAAIKHSEPAAKSRNAGPRFLYVATWTLRWRARGVVGTYDLCVCVRAFTFSCVRDMAQRPVNVHAHKQQPGLYA